MGLNISAKIGRNMEWSAAIPVADASYMIGKAPALYPTKYWRHVANTNEGTEMKITTINDTKWSMIVFFFIAATIPMFANVLGGSLVVENIFSVPGMGGMMVDSINASDHMLTVAILVFYSMISLITVLIVDISYGIIDPRVRMGGKK